MLRSGGFEQFMLGHESVRLVQCLMSAAMSEFASATVIHQFWGLGLDIQHNFR